MSKKLNFWIATAAAAVIITYLVIKIVSGKSLNGQDVVLMVLWVWLAGQIVYEVKPELLSGQRWSVAAGLCGPNTNVFTSRTSL